MLFQIYSCLELTLLLSFIKKIILFLFEFCILFYYGKKKSLNLITIIFLASFFFRNGIVAHFEQ